MKLDIRSDKSLYIEIGQRTYYIDDSTNEKIVSRWLTRDMDRTFCAVWEEEK